MGSKDPILGYSPLSVVSIARGALLVCPALIGPATG